MTKKETLQERIEAGKQTIKECEKRRDYFIEQIAKGGTPECSVQLYRWMVKGENETIANITEAICNALINGEE